MATSSIDNNAPAQKEQCLVNMLTVYIPVNGRFSCKNTIQAYSEKINIPGVDPYAGKPNT